MERDRGVVNKRRKCEHFSSFEHCIGVQSDAQTPVIYGSAHVKRAKVSVPRANGRIRETDRERGRRWFSGVVATHL